MRIRKKTFLLFFTSITLFVLAGILSNYLFLEKFFLYKAKQEFVTVSKEIQKNIEQNKENLDGYIEKIGKQNNIRIVLLDQDWNVQQMSYYQREDNSNIPLKRMKNMEKRRKNRAYICDIFELKNDSACKIIFLSKTKEQQYLVLMKNTAGVRESVTIANQFYLVIGGIMVVIGGIFTAYFSRKMTKPLIEMSEITKELANLRFENRVEVRENNEIGELAASINQMSEQLQENIYTMQQDIVRRKQLVRDVSHELKSPIAVIKGYADGLQYGVAEEKEQREKYCRVIAAECERMDQMIKDLLELSKLEQVTVEPIRERVPLYPIFQELENTYARMIAKKHCRVSVECDKEIIVEADKKMLERIVSNLFGNAVKYVQEQGTIKLSATQKEQGTCIEVFNSGEKIPEPEQNKIWDVFYKVDASRKREEDGHGIGLAIVKTAVELHQGSVFVENRRDGVCFGCYFPKTSQELHIGNID
ncbi:MAG: sensor histidine kinase [Lachnospiraceae bacterium]